MNDDERITLELKIEELEALLIEAEDRESMLLRKIKDLLEASIFSAEAKRQEEGSASDLFTNQQGGRHEHPNHQDED